MSKSHFDIFIGKDSNSHLFTDSAIEFRILELRNSLFAILEFVSRDSGIRFPEIRNLAHGFGLPPFLGVILATITAQLIKLSARQREQRRIEDKLLQALLLEEQELKKKRPFRFVGMNKPKPINRNVEEMTTIATVTPGAANAVNAHVRIRSLLLCEKV